MSQHGPIDHSALIEQLQDWARTLDHAQTFLSRGQYSRVYEATFRTVVAMRQVAADLAREDQAAS